MFGFLIDLTQPPQKEDFVEKVLQLISNYPEDFKYADEFIEEVVHYHILLSPVSSEQLRINHNSGKFGDYSRFYCAIFCYLVNWQPEYFNMLVLLSISLPHASHYWGLIRS